MQPAHTFGTPAAEYFLYEGSTNQLDVAWMDNTSGTPVWHSPLHVPVAPYTSAASLPGAPQKGNDNTIDTSDTRAPEHRVPERLRLDHPPSRRERKGGGRLVQDQPWNRHGCIAGTDQRPESLVLLPLHRGQPGQRRGGRVQRLIDHRIRRGVLHHRPAVYRDRGPGGGAEGRRCPLLENLGRAPRIDGATSAPPWSIRPTISRSGPFRSTRRPPIRRRDSPDGEPGGENSPRARLPLPRLRVEEVAVEGEVAVRSFPGPGWSHRLRHR